MSLGLICSQQVARLHYCFMEDAAGLWRALRGGPAGRLPRQLLGAVCDTRRFCMVTANGALHRRSSQGAPGEGGARTQRGSVAMVSAGEGGGWGKGWGEGVDVGQPRCQGLFCSGAFADSCFSQVALHCASNKQDLATLQMCAQVARASGRNREQVLADGCPSKGSALVYAVASVITWRGPCWRRQLCALHRDRSVGTAITRKPAEGYLQKTR